MTSLVNALRLAIRRVIRSGAMTCSLTKLDEIAAHQGTVKAART